MNRLFNFVTVGAFLSRTVLLRLRVRIEVRGAWRRLHDSRLLSLLFHMQRLLELGLDQGTALFDG